MVTAVWASLAVLVALGSSPSEYEVKAAFLYNFAKFVEWPAESFAAPDDPLRLCIVGADPFGSMLDDTVGRKPIGGRPVKITRLRSAPRRGQCHVLFMAESEDARIANLLLTTSGEPVLTVSDAEDFAERGGMIGMRMDHNRVRFEINMISARQADLKISSQLLKVATQIIGYFEGEP
jgi:hypothetical protein